MKKDPAHNRLVLLAALVIPPAAVQAQTGFGNEVVIDAAIFVARALAWDATLLLGVGTLLVASVFVVAHRFSR